MNEDSKGKYLALFKQIESTRAYTLTISAPGYEPQTRSLTVRGNFLSIFSVVMTPSTGEEPQGGETEIQQPASAVTGTMTLLSPSRSEIHADGPISGWWLRAPGHSAWFTFAPARIRGVASAALNFVFLVTNRANGGSGFTTHPQAEILDARGQILHTHFAPAVRTIPMG
ncbi:MAG: hypothetical protein ABDK94_03520 [Atribacterota bacterium]